MIELNVKMIARRDENGDISEFYVQTVSEIGISNVLATSIADIVPTPTGSSVKLFYKVTQDYSWQVSTPIVHSFIVPGNLLTEEKPVFVVELIEDVTLSKKKKRVLHREDSDEDQLPGRMKS